MSALTDLLDFLTSEQEQRAAANTTVNYLYVPIPLLIAFLEESAAGAAQFGSGAPVTPGTVVGTLYFDTDADYQAYVWDGAWNAVSAVAVP